MKRKPKKPSELADEIISRFDFYSAEMAMVARSRKWHTPDGWQYPSIEQMKILARQHIEALDDPDVESSSSGGFMALRSIDEVELVYIAESYCATR